MAEPSLHEEIRTSLAGAGLSPRHALGQNFMVDRHAVEALVAAIADAPGRRVVEVGPGTGVLTRRLLDAGAEVLAVEFDRGLAALLERELVPRGLTLVVGDALASKTRLHPAIEAFAAAGEWVLGANLPYDVSIPVILDSLCLAHQPARCVVTVQLECAQRLCASPGTKAWGASAAVCQTAARGRILRKLSPRCFHPRPRVDSAILELTVTQPVPPGFPVWCRGLFAYRRKQLTRGLRDHGLERDAAVAVVAAVGLDPLRRVEELGVDELLALFERAADGDRRPEGGV